MKPRFFAKRIFGEVRRRGLRRLLAAGAGAWLLAQAAEGRAAETGAENKCLPLQVAGTQIEDSAGQPVRLKGVNVASLEWTSDGDGHVLKTAEVAIDDWKVNVIRLPLSQDRWFGQAPEQRAVAQPDGGAAYRALVRQVVETCAAKGCHVVLDLHWSDCQEWGQNIGQHSMPDLYSLTFWKACATAYANNPAVIFDLYNEPHDVSWEVWHNGGNITDKPNGRNLEAKTYLCVGMQAMLDTVRATGAKNVVIAGGLDWAYNMKGFLTGWKLSDPSGNGVIYANHCYDNKGQSVDRWIADMEKASAQVAVIVSEFGGEAGPSKQAPADNWLRHVMQAIEEHHWSYIAWDLHPSAGPTLIANWNYTPTPNFGVYVKQMLAGTLPKYTPPPPK
jgi:hypothetical protein